MTDGTQRSGVSDTVCDNADRLGRRLASRYFYVLAAIAALIVLDQAVIQPLLVGLNWYAPVINVAGRQRMLSQKLAKAALAIEVADSDAERQLRCDELRETLTQWNDAFSTLRDGNPSRGIQPIQSTEIELQWNRLAPHVLEMRAAAERILANERATGDQTRSSTNAIVQHEAAFLDSMERIVKLMETEAGNAVNQLRICAVAIAGVVISLLLVLGWCVIRPATAALSRQVDNLEQLVGARTRALSTALTALQGEIAEREKSEAKTQRLAAQLAHAGRVSTMGHLTSGLAHELNQPLAAIANYTEACDVELTRSEKGMHSERLRKNLDGAKQAALRAGEIVRRMRNFLRPSQPMLIDVHVNELLHDVLALCRNEAEQVRAAVSLALTRADATICADPIQIQQVLVNLVQNALQALHRCSDDERRVRVSTAVIAGSVTVEVADSGPGIAPADFETIFDPFFTTKQEGLGIGLSICRSIVEQHGGRIWAEPTSAGTKIAFTLPCSRHDARTQPMQSECVCR